ncbi:MAG: hypothetical protein PHS96_15355, partial [Anaerolineales bacterium]|nr:hypothetical protein [Anaerolineales bacterium]
LTGIVDFFATIDERDGFTGVIHVEDYNAAYLRGLILPPFSQRETFVSAKAHENRHRFGDYMPVEEFIVYLLSQFVQDETTAKILKLVSNLTQGTEVQFSDDGVTQRVTAKAGVARFEAVDVPNPVTLRPFRTFPDIEQPTGLFVVRIKAENGRGPTCALIEADGGAWKNTAIWSIRDFFATKTPGIAVIA